MHPLPYQPYLDQLIAHASTEERKPDLLAAKVEYFQRTGEVFEDDKQFELRMASFLDYYLFDRKRPESGRTPAEESLEMRSAGGDAAELAAFRAFTETVHGLFEVRKIKPGIVRLRELFNAKEFDVTERRHTVGLEKGDILEARLIPFDGALVFSAAFCFHPREAVKSIKKEVKRRKKVMPEAPPVQLTWEAAKRALKADRYRQIAVDKIYDFESSRL
ncbi:MAG TPA: hypothetical protein VFE93_08085 [Myxococcaceae bacterium]|jgi:hypothetical protein|nr:hypothetical protein [Myxococcaceae bacterium]